MSSRAVRNGLLLLTFAAAACAVDIPAPPCGAEPFPPYPAVDAAPSVQVWDRAEWAPPACVGWSPASGSTVVAIAASFRFAGGSAGLRRRIGAISELKGLLYWSTSSSRWQPLILDAGALSGASDARGRKDFAVDEVAAGRILYFEQEDSLFGKAAYRIRIWEVQTERLVFATENTGTLRYLMLPVALPGELQAICFLQNESKEIWRYYALVRIGKGASLVMAGHEASLINRAVASFRHLAGIPADREPPAAR